MIYLCILCAVLTIALIIVINVYNKNKKINFEQYKEKYAEQLKQQYESIITATHQTDSELKTKKEKLNSIEKEIESKVKFNETVHRMREQELDRLIEEEKEHKLALVNLEVQDWAASAQEVARDNYNQLLIDQYKEIRTKQEQVKYLIEQLAEFKAKQNAINEEILRQRALKEKQDFYRIQISEVAKEDIHYLLSIIDNFHNKETIYKLIWSEYLQVPFKAMLNRILGGKEYKNVIYMIQNIDTNEIYVGKTRGEVSKRWTEHIKTSLNIGTISHANIHNALFNHWDKFSFSILENVKSEDKLSERERYYIDFYKSNICGYNIKSGG